MAIEFGGLNQAHDRCRPFSGAQTARKEPILATCRNRPDAILDPVIVNRDQAVADIMDERKPAFETVIDGSGSC